ncbi:MAG TPA: TIGR02588 family protein, partial [Gammaproteobacteria bacterium]|nr:TIGR02588 family protein [Gammaproteobacteria bacterium]
LASLGYLLYQGVWGDRSPPDIVIMQETITGSGKDYLVQFRVRNLGGETAAEVKITGTLSRNDPEVEKSEVTVDYVAAGSERRGGLFFSNDPRDGQLALGVSGYRLP